MTLLERWDRHGIAMSLNEEKALKVSEIRRALAIAQAVDELDPPLMYSSKMQEAYFLSFLDQIKRRAEQLMEKGK